MLKVLDALLPRLYYLIICELKGISLPPSLALTHTPKQPEHYSRALSPPLSKALLGRD